MPKKGHQYHNLSVFTTDDQLGLFVFNRLDKICIVYWKNEIWSPEKRPGGRFLEHQTHPIMINRALSVGCLSDWLTWFYECRLRKLLQEIVTKGDKNLFNRKIKVALSEKQSTYQKCSYIRVVKDLKSKIFEVIKCMFLV